MLELQLVNGKRYHKGTPLQTRGTILVDFGQYKRAKKYIILAHIEDIINGSPNAPAGQTLKLAGISESDLELIFKEAQDHILLHADSPILFPEEIYQKIQYQIEYGSIGELSKQSVFTNPVYLKELWDRVEQSAETDDNAFKRRTLESLAQYLFSSIEGMYSKPSQIAGPYELDGIITNISNHPFLSRLDTYIPIECKNWKEPIGSPEITQFIGKLNLFQCNNGILLSKNGIKEKTVNELRKDAARRNGIYVFVFSERDIKSILNGNDIISLLIEKFEELKFSIKI